jgi:hypothetical protein
MQARQGGKFVAAALSIKGLKLRKAPLDAEWKLNPTIDRSSDNKDDHRAAATERSSFGDTITQKVSGALADTIYEYAPIVEAGTASGRTIDRFAESMGVLYHEASHVNLLPTIGSPAEPRWYQKEVERFKQATNRYGTAPGRHVIRLVDEAIGEYVEHGVTQYFKTHGNLMRTLKAADKSIGIEVLRKEYNAAMAQNRSTPHGYWEIPSEVETNKARNATTLLSQEALNYADSLTGLSGDFDKDFAPQLQSSPK